jgi:hypothetical protein
VCVDEFRVKETHEKQNQECRNQPYQLFYNSFLADLTKSRPYHSIPYRQPDTRDEILGHKFNKRLESFAPCHLQSLLLADFKRKPFSSLVLKLLTKKSGKQENFRLFMNSIL